MKTISRISILMFSLLLLSLFLTDMYSETRYKEQDIEAIGLWYEGSIYKANKDYEKAKGYYEKSLALARNPKLQQELKESLAYLDKYKLHKEI